MPQRKPRTLAESVVRMRTSLASLRKRIGPILTYRTKHNLSADDEFYGRGYLELLDEDLTTIEKQLGIVQPEK